MNITPLVAIRCMTYNHAPYIIDTMNGFCMQQTNFPFVAIIVDDASTDGESEVIRNYISEHFVMADARQWETDDAHFIEARHVVNQNCWFAVVLLKYNFYRLQKSKNLLIAEWDNHAKYIALCEGDDYWTNTKKLQLQVDYLQSSSTCKFCFCKVSRYNQKKKEMKGYWGGDISSLDDAMISENVIPTLTICYDREEYQRYLSEFNPSQYHWRLGDLPLFLWFAHYGGIHFIDVNVGVYRELEDSASHSKYPQKTETFLSDVMNIKLLFDKQYNQSKRTTEINDIFMRKFMYLYAFSFRSCKKLAKSFAKIQNKSGFDYLHYMRYLIYASVGL